jgi:DNA-binding transcriptional ArsR family regulator
MRALGLLCGAAVVTYARMAMRDQQFATIAETAATRASSSPWFGLFRSLADTSHLWCLLALREHPRTVGGITVTGLSQSNVSEHLSRLHGCGLVPAERCRRFVSCGMADPGMEELLDSAGALLARIDRCFDEEKGHR